MDFGWPACNKCNWHVNLKMVEGSLCVKFSLMVIEFLFFHDVLRISVAIAT
jgi:hypothetical protein